MVNAGPAPFWLAFDGPDDDHFFNPVRVEQLGDHAQGLAPYLAPRS